MLWIVIGGAALGLLLWKMRTPTEVRGTLRFSSSDHGGEPVPTLLLGDDFEWPHNIRTILYWSSEWLKRNWTPALCVAAIGAWLIVLGRLWTVVLIAGVAAGLIGWRIKWPASFERYLAADVRAWRRMRRYRRKWQSVMKIQKHAEVFDKIEWHPKICKVIASKKLDRVLVQPLNGQPIEQFQENNKPSGLARTYGAQRCRVRSPREDLGEDLGRFWMDFQYGDTLADIVPPIEPADVPDLRAVPVGLTEFGEPWRLQLFENHLFIAGITRSGKSGLIQAILRGVGPLIRSGVVEVWAVDPKGGMELSPSQQLFKRFAKSVSEAERLLNDAASAMTGTAELLEKAGLRKLEPSTATPFRIVLVDELAHLIYYDQDRERKKSANDNLQLLLSQGGAPGWCVIAAAQDPAKEVIAWRHQFPTVVGLRLKEERQVTMLFGEGAIARGARCDRIPESRKGVAYVALEHVVEEIRVRVAYSDDKMVQETATKFAAPLPRLAAVA